MAIVYHKAVSDAGGAIGAVIGSGVVGEILPEISAKDQLDGATISRKFYLANPEAEDMGIALTLTIASQFATIIFESSGDAQVVGDLTGAETNESPISIVIPASSHKSFWLQVEVPTGSTVTAGYNTFDTKIQD